MENWNEIRTAAQVARLGTISAAADTLGVHRATVNRHIDILEASLGGKLFQRHARGFTPTELGRELLRIADATDEQFSQLQRLSSKYSAELTGEFVVTSIDVLAPFILPLLSEFRQKHPQVQTRFLHSDALIKLEYGEAHIAFRAGPEPQDPDNVVQPFIDLDMSLCASPTYIEHYGKPSDISEFSQHHFIGSSSKNARAPVHKWMQQNVPRSSIAFTSNHIPIAKQAVLAGLGIGFMPTHELELHENLFEIMSPKPEWATQSWLVTHVDLHRSLKVQSFMQIWKAKKNALLTSDV